ncbi:MAG: hypothetical protein LBU04_01420 [Christensenellaceae bacterium]|jgi:ABC-2 type transport system permease protein|nr:hypothetical protein [Christensenellaceae bacterium]
MNSILTILKFDILSKIGMGRKITKQAIISLIINIFFSLVIYTVFITGLYFISAITLSGIVPIPYEYLVVTTGAAMIIETIVCTGILVKNLYYDGENELLLRFPVDGGQIFTAKAIFAFLSNFAIALFFVYPIYVIYGVMTNASIGHYFTSILMLPLITLLPFSIANLIALPVINLTNFIKNRFALILALMIILVIFGFAFYMVMLKGVLEYAQNKSPTLLTNDMRNFMRELASKVIPFNWYANIIYGDNVIVSLLIVMAITICFFTLALVTSKKTVYRIVLKSIERESEAFEIKSVEKVRPVAISLLRKEYLLIFRSLNYSFQYLAMAIAAPLMVYFCNDLASSIGDTSVGGRIIPGLTMLVVIIFITIIVSFASTAISREGNTFYLTKIIPVPYRYQIAIKLILYLVVASGSVLASCIIVGSVFGGAKYGNNVKFSDMISIFSIAEFLIVALSCMAISNDIKTPTFEVGKNGELIDANKNVSTNIIFGCFIAVFFGVFTMITSYVPIKIGSATIINDAKGSYVALLILSFIIAVSSFLKLFFRLDKRYNNIKEQ